MKESTRVLVALGSSVAIGVAISMVDGDGLLHAADLLTPVGALWVNAIRMTVIPLVVSLLITGVASANDLTSVGRLGGRTLLVFFSLLVGAAVIAIPLLPSLFALLPTGARPPLPTGAAEAAGQLAADSRQTFAGWLTSLIPTNPVAAAANGAMVPLILFTLILALAITRLAPRSRDVIVGIARAIADAMLVLVRWVVLVAPIGIFALVLPIAAHAGSKLVGGIGFFIVTYSAVSIIFILLLYPTVAIFGGIPIARFARAALPAQLIAFSSSSSIASLPGLVESAERGLGLSPRTSGFVLPVAVSMFKYAAPISWTMGALFVSWFYNIPLHAPQLATVAFAAVFLAFAAPGVPRGGFIMLAPLFIQIGLPVDGIGVLIAVDAIPDLFATVLNVTGDLAACAIVAARSGPGD